ncbi:MAG: nucleotidyl transferase AbiEii/AbiGii toxin family protein [bacterium]
MIPRNFILEWTGHVPWAEPRQVEQDLIITNALLKLYGNSIIKETLAFRGGTALNKLFFTESFRYSEDIDLVQITSQPIGATIDLIHEIIDPWLGKPKRSASGGLCTLSYRTISDDGFPLKLKIEINTREYFSVVGFQEHQFSSSSSWALGSVMITTYAIEELLGTKMRALYQRRKGRDLFDLYMAITMVPNIDTSLIVRCFLEYMARSGQHVSREDFLKNIEKKLENKDFQGDILPLLPKQKNSFDSRVAYEYLREKLFDKL